MIAVIFEFEPRPGKDRVYFDLAAELRARLEDVDGFVSVERFKSLTHEGKYASLSFWRDEDAVERWRGQAEHRLAQERGKKEIFADFRIRVAEVVRDYTLADRKD
ncbi:MAG TPA: antibiotic biosynthesis monooxygenase [Gammaproteobacteria bacterium]|nr:antibiotic biosynthesis monooxygenase [Gammaproteobacteria bacterium]